MEEQLKSEWGKKLQKLQKNSRFAVKFTEILLEKYLKGKAEIEKLVVKLPQEETGEGELAVLYATAKTNGIRRNLEIRICTKILREEPAATFFLDYYCVEAPAILIDSGSTTLRLSMDERILQCLQEAEERCKIFKKE